MTVRSTAWELDVASFTCMTVFRCFNSVYVELILKAISKAQLNAAVKDPPRLCHFKRQAASVGLNGTLALTEKTSRQIQNYHARETDLVYHSLGPDVFMY